MDLTLLAALSDWLDPSWWWAVLQVILGLGFVIFVHELGHFLAAKACGVKCEKFYVGFDAFSLKIGDRVIVPAKLLHFQWGETEYGIGILPLGGYVKMLGQDDNPSRMAEEREQAMMTEGDGVDGTSLDPRHYMAKTVPQRMLIISAGVIMNMIFAVVFATIAFKSGVNYEPPKVGKVSPGSPAWQNNLDGSSITEISGYRTDDPNVYFNFGHLRELIVLDSDDGPVKLEVLRPGATDPVKLEVNAEPNLIGIKGGGNLKSLGISPLWSPKIGKDGAISSQAADRAEPPIEGGDVIVLIDDKPITNGFDMTSTLAQIPDKEIVMQVRRGGDEGELVNIRMPRNQMKWAGFSMRPGKIRAVRQGSPADKAGIKPMDRLVTIDGQPVDDAFVVQQQMLMKARNNTPVEITVESSDEDGNNAAQRSVKLVPTLPISPSLADEKNGMTIESLGINLLVDSVVSKGMGTESGIQTGDRLVSLSIELNENQKDLPSHQRLIQKPFDFLKYEYLYPVIHMNLQSLEVGTKLNFTVERGSEMVDVVTTVMPRDGYFLETRGFAPTFAKEFYQNESWWVASKNGVRQTIDDASRVLKFLKKLATGKLSVTNLGGPGTIAAVATSEASQGTSRLLLFLTLLSANLAVINFLPIPVLDGGHMVFLAYEGIFRRPPSEKLHYYLSVAGLIFLVGLMLTVISMDIWRFI